MDAFLRHRGGPMSGEQREAYRARDLAIWQAVFDGATLRSVAAAHGLSVERTRQICAIVFRRKGVWTHTPVTEMRRMKRDEADGRR